MWWLPAKIFEWLTVLRAELYRRGLLASRALSDPVISVGNLTVGGTGKTPFVAYLARLLQQAGYQPIVISRGYRGRAERAGCMVSDGETILCGPEECGDEPYLLSKQLPGVPVVIGKNRYRCAQKMDGRFSRGVCLLDDGFQHLALKRNLNILLVDSTDPFGGGKLIPAGRLREPVKALQRADLIVVTRSHLSANSEEIETVVRRIHPLVPIRYFYHDLSGMRDLSTGEMQPMRHWANRRVAVLAALGNPRVLLDDLRLYQVLVGEQFLHRDHHPYSQLDLDRALEPVRRGRAEALVTTEKDAVRLESLDFAAGEVLAVQLQPRAEDDVEYQRYLLNEVETLPPAR